MADKITPTQGISLPAAKPEDVRGPLHLVDDSGHRYGSFHPAEGLVQMVTMLWIPGGGWLTTRRGMTHGGQMAPEEAFLIEAKGSYRAMRHALDKFERERLNADPSGG